MPFDASNLIMAWAARKAAKKARKAQKARSKVRRREIIVEAIATVAREAWRDGTNPTLWTFEGEMIAALRSGLCLEGWGWHLANFHAVEIVGEGLRQAGAKRPSWKEGQPEHCDGGVIRETRIRCANCEKTLELGQKTFCSALCFHACRARQYRSDNDDRFHAIDRLRAMKRANAS